MVKKKINFYKRGISLLMSMVMVGSLFPAGAASAQEPATVTVNQPALQAVYDAPATDWQMESLPLGNGFIGASVFGGIESERILINEHTLWSGGPGADASYDGGQNNVSAETNKSTLKSVRETLENIMEEFSSSYTPTVGNTQDYPATVNADTSQTLHNQMVTIGGEPYGEGNNFGTYQELGSIYIDNLSAGGTYLAASYAENCINTNVSNLFDGNKDTKWFSADGYQEGYTFENPDDLIMKYEDAVTVSGYQLRLGNDSVQYGRVPESWTVYGSQNGTDWTTIQSVTDGGFEKSTDTFETKSYTLDTPVSYQWYKFSFTTLTGNGQNTGNGVQLSELSLTVVEKPYITSYGDHSVNPAEVVESIFDGDVNTKWFTMAGAPEGVTQEYPLWAQVELESALTIGGYGVVSANDTPGRDPKNWELQGSNDGELWTTIDTQTDVSFSNRFEEKLITLQNTCSYRFMRFQVNAVAEDGNGMQISELRFYDANGNQISICGEDVQNYTRILDLDNATATVQYTENGATYDREYFVSNPGNFMAARLTTDETGTLNKLIRFGTAQTAVSITAEGKTITLTGSPADHVEEERLLFAAQIKVKTDGDLTTLQDSIQVLNASYIELYLAAGTNYQQDLTNDGEFDYFKDSDPLDDVKARLAALDDKTYDELKATHLADYQELFGRVKLNLNGMTKPEKTTVELLDGYKSGGNTDGENRYLEALLYQFGRYLLIAASREGSLPSNLQGIWAEGLTPPWNADYHTNINVQMNYWLAEQTNLSECHQPMIDYINSLVDRGEITANHYHYNVNDETQPVRGWTTYHENNIWGNTAPSGWGGGGASYFPTGAAWLCQDIWEQYAFTLDEEKLAASYDTMKSAALFWVDNLVVDPRDGTLVSSPSYSPEHGPYSLGASCDQAIIWELFNNTLQAADVLDDTSEEIEEIRTAMSKLSLPTIGVNGQYMEWKDEITIDVTGDSGHRHVNHLYALHPGTLVVAGRSEEDDEAVEAMKVTLNTRGDGGTGWSMAWKVNFWARLREGNRAFNLLQSQLTHMTSTAMNMNSGGTYSNLLCAHPPFQIDGNYGVTAGMTEMFLQSQGDSIDLLPALPTTWYNSSVSGLVARGNVDVDIAADANGKVATAVLKPGTDLEELKVRADGLGSYMVKDSSGSYVSLNRVDEDTLTFDVEAGETYTLTPGVSVNGVALDKAEITLNAGDSATLAATLTPDNATNQTVTWTSSDEMVATVVNGIVNAVSEGTATITVTTVDGGKTATCVVTVTEDTKGDVDDNGEIDVHDAAMVYAIANGKTDATEAQLAVADVDGDGEVTPMDAAMVYAYANGKITQFSAMMLR